MSRGVFKPDLKNREQGFSYRAFRNTHHTIKKARHTPVQGAPEYGGPVPNSLSAPVTAST
jgi:hypothetical protein